MNNVTVEAWLAEFDVPGYGGQPDPPAGGAPASDAGAMAGPDPMAKLGQNDPNVANMPNQMAPGQEGGTDVSQDPQAPDMPDQEGGEDEDFEQWKNKFFKAAVKGDANELIDILNEVRELENLQPYQRKFVEDNFNIQLLRLNANVDKASKEIRNNLKQNLDRNNPATSVVNHITDVLTQEQLLNQVFIKLNGYGGLKGDLYRKFMAALLCAVQVGSGSDNEDIIFNEKEYSIMISTRFNSTWGNVFLGSWTLREDDAERYLKEAELERLENGSPEEKDVLRRRIVVESISEQFKTRAFIIGVVDDGTIYTLGWDLSGSLKAAYSEGRLVVRTRKSENSEAMIDEDGKIIPFIDLSIHYVKETGEQDEDGDPEVEEIEFIQRRNGGLYLTALLPTMKEAATTLQGAVFKETPYQGNPTDLKTLIRCVYSTHDLLLRQC